MVTSDRLRFDFNLHRGLREAEIARVEELVNGWITEDTALVTREMPLAEAKAAGTPCCSSHPLHYALQITFCIYPMICLLSHTVDRTLQLTLEWPQKQAACARLMGWC